MFGEWGGMAAQVAVTGLVIVTLIAGIIWLVRRYSAGGLGGIGRGRVPRLAVLDAMSIDARRRLILVRRDNVEHLLLVGGPSDLVVEPSIQRTRRGSKPTADGRPAPDAKPATEPRFARAPEDPEPATGQPDSEAMAENPPIPFPKPHIAEVAPVTAEAPRRSFIPFRRMSAVQPTAIETVAPPVEVKPVRIDPEPEPMAAVAVPPPVLEDRPTVAMEAARPNNVSAFSADQPAPVRTVETISKVNDLEREMARLLGEITGRQSS